MIFRRSFVSIFQQGWTKAVSLAQVAARPSPGARAADDVRCASDRCAVKDLLGSKRVPLQLREALREATQLTEQWNELTSKCNGGTCTVSSARLLDGSLGKRSPLMALAAGGELLDATTLALVRADDKEAYARNARRFEASVKYAADCAKLSQFAPPLPSFAKGAYVPKGLTDANGQLLGTNLENARDFARDAADALLVVCSFIYYTR